MSDTETRDAERLAFSSALGFGDGVTEPAATLAEMVDPILEAFDAAHEHNECPLPCELCGERLADTVCPQCHGGGCLPNERLAYMECDTCAGVGKIHEGCAEASYSDLVAERDEAREEAARLRGVVEAVRALVPKWWAFDDDLHDDASAFNRGKAAAFRACGREIERITASVPSSGEAVSPAMRLMQRGINQMHADLAASSGETGERARRYDQCDETCQGRPASPEPVSAGGPNLLVALGSAVDAARRARRAAPASPEPTGADEGEHLTKAERNALDQSLADSGCHGFLGDHPDLYAAAERILAARLAARPVLSREALAERMQGHWPTSRGCICEWTWDHLPRAMSEEHAAWRDHLAAVLDTQEAE